MDGGFVIIIMSVVNLNQIRHSQQRGSAYLFLIDSNVIVPMIVAMSMIVTVAVAMMMMPSSRVHPKQIDSKTNTADPQ